MEKFMHGRHHTDNEFDFEKCFLLTNNFYEPKEKKFEFNDKVSSVINSIKNNVSLYYNQKRMRRNANSLNNTKDKVKNFLPYKKLHTNNVFFLNKKKRLKTEILVPFESKINFRSSCDSTNYKVIKNIIKNKHKIKLINNINTDNNLNYSSLEKSDTLQKKICDSIKRENPKKVNNKNLYNSIEKFSLNKDILSEKKIRLPNIKSNSVKKDNTKNYIKKSINSIEEITEDLQKNLEQKEQDNYWNFKKKYNNLVIKSKKNELNTDQFLGNPKDRLPFPPKNRDPKNKNIIAVKRVIKKIFRNVKFRDNGKKKIKEIIDEVNNFQTHENIFRSRLQKGHERFYYLIDDSKMIQSRINNINNKLNISQ